MIGYNENMPKVKGVLEKRQSRGWTQEQLAQISGVDARTIQRIEKKQPAALSTLQALASAFQCSVEDILEKREEKKAGDPKKKEPKVYWLIRLKTGKELMDIAGGAHMFQQDYDEPRSPEESEAIASFLQDVQDYGELWGDFEPSQRVKSAFECNALIKEVESHGLSVFGVRRKVVWISKADPTARTPMDVGVVIIKRSDDPRIIKKDGVETLPSVFEDFQ